MKRLAMTGGINSGQRIMRIMSNVPHMAQHMTFSVLGNSLTKIGADAPISNDGFFDRVTLSLQPSTVSCRANMVHMPYD